MMHCRAIIQEQTYKDGRLNKIRLTVADRHWLDRIKSVH